MKKYIPASYLEYKWTTAKPSSPPPCSPSRDYRSSSAAAGTSVSPPLSACRAASSSSLNHPAWSSRRPWKPSVHIENDIQCPLDCIWGRRFFSRRISSMGVPSAAIYKSRMPSGVTSDTMWWVVCLFIEYMAVVVVVVISKQIGNKLKAVTLVCIIYMVTMYR